MKSLSSSTCQVDAANLEEQKKGDEGPEQATEKSSFAMNTMRVLGLFALLYTFVCSLDLLSSAFRLLAGKTAGSAFTSSALVNNPVAALMMGVIATVAVQSSSTSTSIIVAMVSSGILKVQPAIPIIMGANIGTSITNTFVALAQSGDRTQFRRAFAAATVHDMFNWLTVIILLPIEVATGYLFYCSQAIVTSLRLDTVRGLEFDLLKTITSPITSRIIQLDKNVIEEIAMGNEEYMDEPLRKIWCRYQIGNSSKADWNYTSPANRNVSAFNLRQHRIGTEKCPFILNFLDLADVYIGVILLAVALGILCGCLILLVKLLHSMMQASLARVIIRTINAELPGRARWLTGYLALLVGMVMTMVVQSSSVFTSALTPLAGVGALSMEKLYPLTLGSNIGTTVTGILAALAAPGDKLPVALQIALCHMLFNMSGTLLFYPVPFMRRVPLHLARFLGRKTAKYRWFAVLYILVVFFLVPVAVCLLSMLGVAPLCSVLASVTSLLIIVLIINYLQQKKPAWLPELLRNWDWLPLWMHSLQPLDRLVSKCMCCKSSANLRSSNLSQVLDDKLTAFAPNNALYASDPSFVTSTSTVCLTDENQRSPSITRF